ncbi:DUF2207 domain-containing protein [Leifsonia sp. NCR5]|uniref:DUF2207 domain-containing protein n=1 Tax=Leifsonia sp. NCR5 TaxID=1978342 RepID=UPI0015C4BBE2|nr:DUF2207 domain-containing protein [Leifsonia sp. NCR5]
MSWLPGIRAVVVAAVVALGLIGAGSATAAVAAGLAQPAGPAQAAGPVRADAADFTFDSFDADYTLTRDANKDSTLTTIETLVAEFPSFDQNHGIVRAIPLSNQHTDLRLDVRSVTDADGTAIPFTRDDQDGFARLTIGSADAYVHGRQTYVITYTQRFVVRPFADTHDDEFYWDVNGTGWDQPFGKVSARLHLDSALTSALTRQQSCYVGEQGSTAPCTISSAPAPDGTVISVSQATVPPRQNVTIAVGFRPGTFAPPPDARDAFPFAVLPWILLAIAALIVAGALVARSVLWRTTRGRGIIVPQYTPPPGVFPALAATLLKREDRALPAQLVGFAVNRVAAIIDHSDASQSRPFGLRLLADPATVRDDAERDILTRVFGAAEPGNEEVLDPQNQVLGDRLAGLGGALNTVVAQRGLRARPKSRLPLLFRLGIVLILIAWIVVFAWSTTQNATTAVLGWGFAGVIVATIAVFPLSAVPNLLTEKGVELRDYLLGLRDYLALAEADRFRVLQSPEGAERVDARDGTAVVKLNEKLLPYAIVWGVEKEWMRELAHSYEVTATQPEWMPGSANPALLPLQVAAFSSLYHGTPFATTPPVSSYSGSGGSSFTGGASGGGFSGGGGGGGGGGGW